MTAVADHAPPDLKPASISLRREIASTFLRLRWVHLVVALLACLVVLAPYARIAHVMPNAEWDARFMFVMGDIQYFDQIRSIAELDFGQASVLEGRGVGFVSFPIVSLAPAAFFYALLGPAGLIVNSILSLLASVGLSRVLFRVMGLDALPATLGAMSLTLVPWFEIGKFGVVSLLSFWNDRLGRPVGTIPLLLVALIAFSLILRSSRHRQSASSWTLLAIGVAMLLQGNFHTGVVVGLASLGLWIWTTIIDRSEWSRVLRRTLLASAVGVFAMTPFLVARVLEHPDGPTRLGRVPVDRLRPFIDQSLIPYACGVFAISLAFAAVAWFALRTATIRSAGQIDMPARPLIVWPAFIVLAFFALPISTIILGQGAQMFHFRESLRILATVGLCAGAVLALTQLIRRKAIVAAVCLLPVVAHLGYAWTAAPVAATTYRFDLDGTATYASHTTEFRTAFGELCRELKSDRYRDDLVLGSFDPGVSVWWTFTQGRFTFMPDILTATLPEAEIERRFVIFCRAIGMSKSVFLDRITREHTLFFRLGQGRYTANSRYTLDPIETYLPEDQASIRRTHPTRAWNMKLSTLQRDRLLNIFVRANEVVADPPRLDVIVLTPREIESNLMPPGDRFERTYENAFFQVYRRRAEGGV
jgi:hypothetical protein